MLKRIESVQAENMELRRHLEMVEKRLKDVYERDSQYERGKIIIYWIL